MFEITLFSCMLRLVTIVTLFFLVKIASSYPFLCLPVVVVGVNVGLSLMFLTGLTVRNINDSFSIKKNLTSELLFLLEEKRKGMVYTRQWFLQ